MNRKSYLFLFVVGLLVAVAISGLQSSPGYMDADYYYAGGTQLASGKGFNEPYIWNYLDNPASLPHPSNTYWMPLSSLIAAAGMILGGSHAPFRVVHKDNPPRHYRSVLRDLIHLKFAMFVACSKYV